MASGPRGPTLYVPTQTLVGRFGRGFADGELRRAQLLQPAGLCVCIDGSVVIADTGNRCLRRLHGDAAPVNLVPRESMRLTHVALFAGNPKAGGDAAAFSGGSAREGAYPENELDAPVSVVQLPAGEILVADAGSHTIKVAVVEKVKKPWTDGWSTAASKPMCRLTTLVGRGGKPGCVDGKGKVPGMPSEALVNTPASLHVARSGRVLFVQGAGADREAAVRELHLVPCVNRNCAHEACAAARAAKAPLKASVKTVVGGRPRATLDAVAALLDASTALAQLPRGSDAAAGARTEVAAALELVHGAGVPHGAMRSLRDAMKAAEQAERDGVAAADGGSTLLAAIEKIRWRWRPFAQPTGVVELTAPQGQAPKLLVADDGVLLVVDDTIWVDNQQNSADEPTDANKENADALTAVAGDDGQPMQLWGSVHLSTTRGGAVLAAHEGGNAIYRLLSPDVRRKVAKEAARTSDEFSRVVDALALDCAQLEEQVAAADADLDAAHADAAAALTALHRITYGAECDALVSEARTGGGAAAARRRRCRCGARRWCARCCATLRPSTSCRASSAPRPSPPTTSPPPSTHSPTTSDRTAGPPTRRRRVPTSRRSSHSRARSRAALSMRTSSPR